MRALWSAGFVVLLVGNQPSLEISQLLATTAGEALFDFANLEHQEIIAQILSRADSLKIQPAARKAGKVD